MGEIFAVVRKERSYFLKKALTEEGIPYVSWLVKGRGKEGGLRYKGLIREKVLMPFLPKVAFSILCAEEEEDRVIGLIMEKTHTGAYGDGKIFLIKEDEEESTMKMVKAVIRPEKVYEVIKALEKKGLKAMTMWDVVGRGKEGGVQVGETPYDELAKTMLMVAVEEKDLQKAVDTIMKTARTGAYGDGKIFVCNISQVWTIRTKEKGL